MSGTEGVRHKILIFSRSGSFASQVLRKTGKISDGSGLKVGKDNPWVKFVAGGAQGLSMNGTNSSPLWGAAPTGQTLLLPKTQGGAGACPGLWDAAPLGLQCHPGRTVSTGRRDFTRDFPLMGFFVGAPGKIAPVACWFRGMDCDQRGGGKAGRMCYRFFTMK